VEADEEEALLATAERRAPNETTATVKIRLTQSLFRRAVLAAYGGTCAVSGLKMPTLLVASHIIPWSRDEQRRADPRNGIALSSLHDKAFDRGLLTFDADSRLILSAPLRAAARGNAAGEANFLKLEGQPLRLPERFLPDPAALAWHREHVFKAA
jgi:predicted restriction endonuclease